MPLTRFPANHPYMEHYDAHTDTYSNNDTYSYTDTDTLTLIIYTDSHNA